jgi:ribose 5-phosphate isomerase A
MALCWFEQGLANPHGVAERLSARAGIVEHGLFLDMASMVIVAGQGGVHTLEKNHD